MYKILLVAVAAVGIVQAGVKSMKAFNDARIPTDLNINAPPKEMKLEFPSSILNVKATYGNKLALADVASLPFTRWELPSDDSIQYYTLLAIDLDAPNSDSGTGYLLWLNTNITGDYAGDIDFEYEGPRGENHRIAFLVFYQKASIAYNEGLIRNNFNVASYATKNGLTIWAGNFFYTK